MMRRAVTGETRDGKAVMASDTLVPAIEAPLVPGGRFYLLWGATTGKIRMAASGTLPSEATAERPANQVAKGAAMPAEPASAPARLVVVIQHL